MIVGGDYEARRAIVETLYDLYIEATKASPPQSQQEAINALCGVLDDFNASTQHFYASPILSGPSCIGVELETRH